MEIQPGLAFAILLSMAVAQALDYTSHGECELAFDEDNCEYLCRCPYGKILPIHYFDRDNVYYRNCYPSVNNRYYPVALTLERNVFFNSFYLGDLSELISNLTLRNNGLREVPYFPNQMKTLKTLDVSQNFIKTVELKRGYALNPLKELNLAKNQIESVIFDNFFTELYSLNISHNLLKECPKFKSLTVTVNQIDLSFNSLNTLQADSFDGVQGIVILNVTSNKITAINSSLRNLKQLKYIDFSYNNLEFIRAEDFKMLVKLEYLDLSGNVIKHIDKTSFIQMTTLTSLNLSSNSIDSIESGMTNGLKNLKSIDLSENQIKVLPVGLFKNCSVTFFSIKNNVLEGFIQRGTFEGVTITTVLDLSHQKIQILDNYTFVGLIELHTLLLNNNEIEKIPSNNFVTLHKLFHLDLSSNKLTYIEFDTGLTNLRILNLQNNLFTQITSNLLQNLPTLDYLNVKSNQITNIDDNFICNIPNLLVLEISDNPIDGVVSSSLLNGSRAFPSLDLSRTELTAVNNNSFNGMFSLRKLNISFSKLGEIQYNAFNGTGYLEIIDLSHNQLTEFNVNLTALSYLKTLLIGHNNIKNIQPFKGLTKMKTISLSYNDIEEFSTDVFSDQTILQNLDLSFNKKLQFDAMLLEHSKLLHTLSLSGIQTDVSLNGATTFSLKVLNIAECNFNNLTVLKSNVSIGLESVDLSGNNVTFLNMGIFSSIVNVRTLDVSNNSISMIQPGAFKDNVHLNSLNLSHNFIKVLEYGIFRGLTNLRTLDVSNNLIDSLQGNRFYELNNLEVLIADHNRISNIDEVDFSGTKLETLSIGDNLLPCELMINLNRNSRIKITATKLHEHLRNHLGITCVDKKINNYPTDQPHVPVDQQELFNDMRSVLIDISHKLTDDTGKDNTNLKFSEKIHIDNLKILSQMTSTNDLLGKLIKAVSSSNKIVYNITAPVKGNLSVDNLTPYINSIKEQLEDSILNEKENILRDMEIKLADMKETLAKVSETPEHEKLMAKDNETKSSVFTETCVGFILFILVCLVLYKVYKSKVFVAKRRSASTRNFVESIENSNL